MVVGTAGSKMVEHARKDLDVCKTSLTEAEQNLETANERAHETDIAKIKLEKVR